MLWLLQTSTGFVMEMEIINEYTTSLRACLQEKLEYLQFAALSGICILHYVLGQENTFHTERKVVLLRKVGNVMQLAIYTRNVSQQIIYVDVNSVQHRIRDCSVHVAWIMCV